MNLTIATRQSRLALWQAQFVQTLLEQQGHHVKLLGLTTRGDQILDRTLGQIGGKGLFIKELETALALGHADLAVHSLKDVPMEIDDGFCLVGATQREDPRDAWVSNHYERLEDLPLGAVVGTSSLRRAVLLRALRPDLQIEPLRGNLDTRLDKLDQGRYAGIVLAAAGLIRLGLTQRIRQAFSVQQMLPAAGQGALGLEMRSDRVELGIALSRLTHADTWLCVSAERAVSKALGGSCLMPLATHAQIVGQRMHLHAIWGDQRAPIPRLVSSDLQATVNSVDEAQLLGVQVAALLQNQGAPRLAKDAPAGP